MASLAESKCSTSLLADRIFARAVWARGSSSTINTRMVSSSIPVPSGVCRTKYSKRTGGAAPSKTLLSPFPCLPVAALITPRFRIGYNFGLFLIHLWEELPYVIKQEIGLFQSREVSALGHRSALDNVVSPSNPTQRTRKYLLGEIRVRHRGLQPGMGCRFSPGEPVLTIDSHGGAHRTRHPIERVLYQQCVAVYRAQ